MSDPREIFDRVVDAVLRSEGETEPPVREAMAELTAGGAPSLPPELRALASTLRDRPTQADIEGLLAGGRSEDEVFELVLAGAVGAGRRRLEVGTDALREVFDSEGR